MRAITIPVPGGPDALVWAEVPDPEPGAGEVIVEVAASAVNRADLLQRQGHYPPPPGVPAYPGLECSGVIGAVGAGVTGWAVGQPVCALLAGGGYAERVAVPAGQLLPVPAGVDPVDAAALPEVACTVWSNLVGWRSWARARPCWCMAAGAGSARSRCSSARRWARPWSRPPGRRSTTGCASWVPRTPIDYREQDFVEETRRVTDGRGADVILDIMGASYLARNVAALADGGRLVVIGMQGGRKAELDLGALLAKRASVAATALRSRPLADKADIVRGVREQVWPLVESGMIRPIVDRRLPMRDAAQAHRLVESSDHVGKVLLTTA